MLQPQYLCRAAERIRLGKEQGLSLLATREGTILAQATPIHSALFPLYLSLSLFFFFSLLFAIGDLRENSLAGFVLTAVWVALGTKVQKNRLRRLSFAAFRAFGSRKQQITEDVAECQRLAAHLVSANKRFKWIWPIKFMTTPIRVIVSRSCSSQHILALLRFLFSLLRCFGAFRSQEAESLILRRREGGARQAKRKEGR